MLVTILSFKNVIISARTIYACSLYLFVVHYSILICTCVSQFHNVRFISDWFLPARRYASAGTSYGPVSVYLSVRVCLSQVGVLSKRMNDPSWVFLHGGFFGPILHYVVRKFRYLQQ